MMEISKSMSKGRDKNRDTERDSLCVIDFKCEMKMLIYFFPVYDFIRVYLNSKY